MIAALYARLLDLCGLIAGFGIGLIALGTGWDVFARNVFGESVRGMVDLVEYALYATTFIAAPWVLRKGGHVQVDFVVASLRPAARRAVERIADVVGLAISVVLLIWSIRVTVASWQQGNMVIKALVFPEWWVYVVMPFSALLLIVEFTIRLTGRRAASAASAA